MTKKLTPIQIEALRHHLGYSRRELSQLLQISYHSIRAWEAGEYQIPELAQDLLQQLQTTTLQAEEAARQQGHLKIGTPPIPLNFTPPRGWWLGVAGRLLNDVEIIE